MNWIRIFNMLFEIINPTGSVHSDYFSGPRFIDIVREFDHYFPTYPQYMEERKVARLSTSRKDYFYDILMHFSENQRIEIINRIIESCEKTDSEKIRKLKQAIGSQEENVSSYENLKHTHLDHESVKETPPIELDPLSEENKAVSPLNDQTETNKVQSNPIQSSAPPVRATTWYKQPKYFVPIIAAIIVGTFGIINVILPWYLYKNDATKSKEPIIKMRVDPLVISADSALYKKINYLFFYIETSNGIYKILENFTLSSLQIKKPEYFYESFKEPNIIFKEVRIDRFILDSKRPDIQGVFLCENDFILKGDKLADLKSGEQKEIAEFVINFPYRFEGKSYTDRIRIPVILKGYQKY